MIHTVKGFGIVNKAEIDVFLEISCFFDEWLSSKRGMNDFSIAFGFIAPEISGLIEPSLLFGSRREQRADDRLN